MISKDIRLELASEDINAMKWLEDKLKKSVKAEEVEAKYNQAVWCGYIMG